MIGFGIRIEFLNDHVVKIDPASVSLQLKSGKPLPFDKLVIATGCTSNKFGWSGQDLEGVQ
ncbi:MAG: FAD-dependent oxidoreductase [Bacteroidetes bacterium]|nr:FAD-dependent oxidoreductase [Bacteroidota bacterium]